jgi:hypothetical protein
MRIISVRRFPAVYFLLVVVSICVGCSANTTPTTPSALVAESPSAASSTADVAGDLAAVRRAVARFHNIDEALAAGYRIEGEPCVPGMGYHAVNLGLVLDPAIDPLQPEVLVYAQLPSGGYRLVAVEYLKFFGEGIPTPTLFGQTFDGPMPGHSPRMPVHWDLHVWLFAHNPDGIFAAVNPTQTCE